MCLFLKIQFLPEFSSYKFIRNERKGCLKMTPKEESSWPSMSEESE